MSPAAQQQALAKAEAHLTREEWEALIARVEARQEASSRWKVVEPGPTEVEGMPKPLYLSTTERCTDVADSTRVDEG